MLPYYFFLELPREYMYLISGSLGLHKEPGNYRLFLQLHFASMLWNHFIIWYYIKKS